MEKKIYYYVYSNNPGLGYILESVCETYNAARLILMAKNLNGFIKKHTDEMIINSDNSTEKNQHYEIHLIKNKNDIYYNGNKYSSFEEAKNAAELLSKDSNMKYEVHLITEELV